MKLSKIAALLMLPVLALTRGVLCPQGRREGCYERRCADCRAHSAKAVECRGGGRAVPAAAAKENEIFASDNALWEKVFLAANKDTPMIEDGKNYGDFLLDTIEGAKDQFAADELKTLKAGAQQVKEIEDKLMALEKEFPGCGSTPGEGRASMPRPQA